MLTKTKVEIKYLAGFPLPRQKMHELTKDSKTFFHFLALQTFRKLTIVGRRRETRGQGPCK